MFFDENMEKSKKSTTNNGIIIINPNDPKLLRLRRGIQFWKDDLEYPKISSALGSISDVVESYFGHKLNISMAKDTFTSELNKIAEAAYFVVASEKDSNTNTELKLQRIDVDIINPFVFFVRKNNIELQLAESNGAVLSILYNVATDEKFGSNATLKKLDNAAYEIFGSLVRSA